MDLIEQLEKRARNRKAYEHRIEYLANQEWETDIIKEGVDDVISELNKGNKSIVVYGEPQSGKTEFMIALVCYLLDEGRKSIFLIMNDNTELEAQNFKRFKMANQLDPIPMKAKQFMDLPNKDKKTDQQRIIFCRKNSPLLKKLIEDARFLKDRIVIDDEADYASPDNKKNKPLERSQINTLVSKLGELQPIGEGTYIGVTATPGRLDLNNTFLTNSKHWSFLKSHSSYKGRSFFFPLTREDAQKSNYQLKRLPEDGDDPKHLREAFLRFLVKVAFLNLKEKLENNPKCYTMLIHTDGKTSNHEKDRDCINEYLSSLINFDNQARKMLDYMKKFAGDTISKFGPHSGLTPDQILNFIDDHKRRSEALIINHKNDKDNVDSACNPDATFTFAIGGDIVSRGLTFNNLLTFFFSRSVKGKMQQNTYIQRARMFGNRPYAEFFELCIPDLLYEDWAECFADHEMSIRSAKSGNYEHVSSRRNSPAAASSIDRKTVVSGSKEWLVGDIFPYDEEIEKTLTENLSKPLTTILELIDAGIIPSDGFKNWAVEFIKLLDTTEDDIEIIRDKHNKFFFIEANKDGNSDSITRERGGLIIATLKGSKLLQTKSHLIMPVRNKESKGQMRFHYRNQLGKRILRNTIHG